MINPLHSDTATAAIIVAVCTLMYIGCDEASALEHHEHHSRDRRIMNDSKIKQKQMWDFAKSPPDHQRTKTNEHRST